MFKWTYSETVITEATPEQIWAMWQNVSSWPCWDVELKWVKLNGDFIEGTTGKMKAINGPEVDFTLCKVEINRAFSDVAKLPLTTLVFNHEYLIPLKKGESARICHTITMTGWLAPVFGRLIGNNLKKHLRSAMEELSKQALTIEKSVN